MSLIRINGLLNFDMKKVFVILAALIALLSLALSACKNDLTGNAPIVFPPSNVSYSKQVQPFMDEKCAFPGCHDDNAPGTPATVSFTTYDNICYSVSGIVEKGDANGSLLGEYVNGKFQHDPLMSSLMNQNQVQGIITWINEGAPEN